MGSSRLWRAATTTALSFFLGGGGGGDPQGFQRRLKRPTDAVDTVRIARVRAPSLTPVSRLPFPLATLPGAGAARAPHGRRLRRGDPRRGAVRRRGAARPAPLRGRDARAAPAPHPGTARGLAAAARGGVCVARAARLLTAARVEPALESKCFVASVAPTRFLRATVRAGLAGTSL